MTFHCGEYWGDSLKSLSARSIWGCAIGTIWYPLYSQKLIFFLCCEPCKTFGSILHRCNGYYWWHSSRGVLIGLQLRSQMLPIISKNIFYFYYYYQADSYRSMIYCPSRGRIVLNSTQSAMHIAIGLPDVSSHLAPASHTHTCAYPCHEDPRTQEKITDYATGYYIIPTLSYKLKGCFVNFWSFSAPCLLYPQAHKMPRGPWYKKQ